MSRNVTPCQTKILFFYWKLYAPHVVTAFHIKKIIKTWQNMRYCENMRLIVTKPCKLWQGVKICEIQVGEQYCMWFFNLPENPAFKTRQYTVKIIFFWHMCTVYCMQQWANFFKVFCQKFLFKFRILFLKEWFLEPKCGFYYIFFVVY